jgi:phage baseplate assembly protein W
MATLVTSQKQSLEVRLGSDLKFPIDGSFEPISGLNLLLQDIQQLLLTVPGERVNRPEYGCQLRNQIWENIDTVARTGPASIKTAIQNFEPRINLITVDSTINRNTSLITFTIKFIVINTDVEVNLIFPFRTGTTLSFA